MTIPTYNLAGLVTAAINSVLAQALQGLQIIVVGDGSTDQTEDLLCDYAKDLHCVRIEHCGLLGRSRNAGLKVARGESSAFLDSDDLWTPEKLARQLDVLEREPNVGIICSNAQALRCGESGQSGGWFLEPDEGRSERVVEELLLVNFIIASSKMVHCLDLNRMAFFTEEHLLRGIGDYDRWLRGGLGLRSPLLGGFPRNLPRTPWQHAEGGISFSPMGRHVADPQASAAVSPRHRGPGGRNVCANSTPTPETPDLASLIIAGCVALLAGCVARMIWEEPWRLAKLPYTRFRRALRRAHKRLPRSGTDPQAAQMQK